jgi:hypothetical protein
MASAGSFATLNPFTFGTAVSGSLRSQGSVTANTGGVFDSASWAAMIIEAENSRVGSIDWAVHLDHSKLGGFQWIRKITGSTLADPISFKVTDLDTGAIVEGTLFSLSSDFLGVGSLSWTNGTFTLNALDADSYEFHIDLDSPFTIQQGTADLRVDNGVITVSQGTGMFAGIFPAVGTPGNFAVPFDNDLTIDYNLDVFPGNPVNVQFTIDNAQTISNVPEPSTLALLGSCLLIVAGVARRLK